MSFVQFQTQTSCLFQIISRNPNTSSRLAIKRKENRKLTRTLVAQALRNLDTLGKWVGVRVRLDFDMRACGIVLGIRVAGARPDLVDAEEVLTRWGLRREFGDELRGN
jgi:hypothetical protein